MKKRVLIGGCLVGVFAAASALAARPDYWKPNYDKSKIAPYTLEDPLTFVDGTKVASPADWTRRRREILGIFAKEMFGQEPSAPEAVVVEKVEEGVTLAGFGIRRQYRMWFKADKSGPAIDWLVLLPRWAKKPALPIIFLNYGGNYELIRDKQVVTPDMWIALRPAHKCVEELRGRYEDMNSVEFVFPAHMILARGYALVTACYAQVSPDVNPGGNPSPWSGVFDLWPKRDPARDDNTTSIGAWAWALSRGLDLAYKIPELDAKKAIAAGYSRLGKTALLAAARDERFAACVPNQTGGGGCPLAKRDWGENVATEMRSFRHWYCPAYKKYEKPLVLSCVQEVREGPGEAAHVRPASPPCLDRTAQALRAGVRRAVVRPGRRVPRLQGGLSGVDVPWQEGTSRRAVPRRLLHRLHGRRPRLRAPHGGARLLRARLDVAHGLLRLAQGLSLRANVRSCGRRGASA